MNRYLGIVLATIAFLLTAGTLHATDDAALLPNAIQYFMDANGRPLANGKVYFYTPSTTTAKTTWTSASKATPQANPVQLGISGRPTNPIYGDGSYRQLVKDANNNTIWDFNTASTGSGGSSPTATGDGDLVGTIKPWAGHTAPNQYVFTYGQAISRTTYSALFTAITSAQSVFCTSGSPTVTGLADTNSFWIGMTVEIGCLAAGNSTVVSKTSSTVTLAANANVSTSVTATFFPWGRGDGFTTFNVPDLRGVVPAGNNIMGGTASSNLTTTYFGSQDPNSAGALGGSQSTTLVTGNLPPYTPAGTIAGTGTPVFKSNGVVITAGPAPGGTIDGVQPGTGSLASITGTFTGSAQGGTSTAFSRVQPTRTTNYIIKVTPDSNSATASGVTSLGGMTGDIACNSSLTCTGNTIGVNTASGIFLVAANNLSDLANKTTAQYNLFNGQIVGYTPEMAGALNDGSSNDTRYFAAAATTISGLTGRRQMTLLSGAGYRVTPLQFGGSNPTTGTATGGISDGAGGVGTILNVTDSPTVPITIGQSVTGASAGTIVTGFGPQTNGGVGTYTVNNAQLLAPAALTFTAPSITASISGTTMTVSAVANGKLNLVDSLVGTGIIPGTTIVAQLTGSTGLAGTYTVSYSQTVAATTVRAYPYTVVAIPNGIVGAPGGETATLLKGWGTAATPNSVIKIVDPPALGAVLGFEVGNFRVDGNALYGSPLSFHGFSATSSGGVPWAHDISVVAGTRDTCGVYVLGNAPAAISWGAIEASMTNISSTANEYCGFRFDGNSGTGNYNIQSIVLNGLKANGNVAGNGIEFDYTNFVCIACLGQSNGGVGFRFDHVNTGQIIGGYTEDNTGGASHGTANTKRLDITGQFEEGVNATLQACGTCNIKYNSSGGAYRNDGNVMPLVAVTTSPTAGQGILGSSAGAGLQLFGRGATYDVTLYNWGGTVACGILTGTQQLDCNAFSIGTKTLSVGGNWAMLGAFTFAGTLTGNTAVTFPTSGTLATTAGASIPTIATGDLLYGSAANTLSALADVATGNALISGGVGVAPSWGKVSLATLATQATNTVVGNATSGTASPTALAVGSCSTAASALIWTTNTGFGCNTSITAAAVPVGGITGLGTGVATALAVNVGTAGSPVINGGALGSPSSAGTLPAYTLGGAVTGNSQSITGLSYVTATGSTNNSFGPGGVAAANGTIIIDGGSGAGAGARLLYSKNSVATWITGSQSALLGGASTSSNYGWQSVATGNIAVTFNDTDDTTTFRGGVRLGPNAVLAIDGDTAPTATTFCTSPSIPANNGTSAFTINVGTACASSTGTITLPAAATGWVCDFHNVTTPASNVVEMTGGSTTTVTMTNYARTTGLASNWTDSHVIRAKCMAY